MCGIIARDKRTGQDVKKAFKHYEDAIRWLYKYAGRNRKYTFQNMFPKKNSYFWNYHAKLLK